MFVGAFAEVLGEENLDDSVPANLQMRYMSVCIGAAEGPARDCAFSILFQGSSCLSIRLEGIYDLERSATSNATGALSEAE